MVQEPERYDILIRGATALTAEPGAAVVKDAVIGIRDRRIALLGSAASVDGPVEATRTIAAEGRVVTPGFINVHTHAVLCLLRGVSEDMGFAPAYTRGVPHGHDIPADEAVALARLGALEAMLFGSTVINDSYVHADATLPAMGELGLRVHACGRLHDVDFTRVHMHEWEYRPEIGERALDDALDLARKYHGAMDQRLGVQLAPHAPDTCSTPLLRRIVEARDATGLRVNTHLAQSKLEVERVHQRDARTPAELLDEIGLLDERLIAAHGLFLNDDDIQLLARSGATLAHSPKVNAVGGYQARTSAMRRAGVPIAMGTDAMHADMVELMRWALAAGRVQEGHIDAFWQPHHVFHMATLGGARAMGLGEELGSLRIGKKADLVLFDCRRPHLTPLTDPLGTLVHTGQGRDVEMVIVDGQVVVMGGRAVRVDEDAVRREAAAAAGTLWQHARENRTAT